jgi:hypothetical protein
LGIVSCVSSDNVAAFNDDVLVPTLDSLDCIDRAVILDNRTEVVVESGATLELKGILLLKVENPLTTVVAASNTTTAFTASE